MNCRVVSLLLVVFSCCAVSCSNRTPTQVRGTLQGGGASFPAPLYEKWISAYRKAHPESRLSYLSVGSGAGIELFKEGKLDFGASDAGMTDAQIQAISDGVYLVPMAAGQLVLGYNLPGLTEPLKLSREVYAGIFMGTITSWSDPKIVVDNPKIVAALTAAKLADLKISTVHRAGASGTTFVFTKHLSAINDGWNKKVGTGLTVNWPVGSGEMGSEIADKIKKTPGAIGYLSHGTAQKHNLALASLQNKTGVFVAPTLESGQAALAAVELADNLQTWIPDPEGKDSYPMVTFTWIIVHKKYADAATAAMVKDFLKYGLTEGQKESGKLGYIPLPPRVVEKALQQVERIGP